MGYEIFEGRRTRISTAPFVSITKYNRLTFNSAAAKILKDNGVERALLLWNGGALRFAVKATTDQDSRAYPVRYNPKGRGAAINARTFIAHIGYDNSKTRSFNADWNASEELLEIDLPAKHFPQLKES